MKEKEVSCFICEESLATKKASLIKDRDNRKDSIPGVASFPNQSISLDSILGDESALKSGVAKALIQRAETS